MRISKLSIKAKENALNNYYNIFTSLKPHRKDKLDSEIIEHLTKYNYNKFDKEGNIMH